MLKIEKVTGTAIDKYDDFIVAKRYEKITGTEHVATDRNGIEIIRDYKGELKLVSYIVLYKGMVIEKGRKIAVFKNHYGYQFTFIVKELTRNHLKDLEEEYRGKFIKVYDVETEDEFYKHLKVSEDGVWKEYAKSKVGREEIERLRTEIDELNKGV